MRVYIAGPMTGLPEYNFPAFHAAAAAWRAAGWEVLNPAESFNGDTSREYKEYVAHDMTLLRSCDAIAMLHGWDGPNARGSVWEREVALLLGLAVHDAASPVAPPAAETILQEAQRLVHGNRGADYGHPIDDYTRTSRMWEGMLGLPEGFIGPRKATLMMALMKVSRECNKHKRDNLTDLAGYAECAAMISDREANHDVRH